MPPFCAVEAAATPAAAPGRAATRRQVRGAAPLDVGAGLSASAASLAALQLQGPATASLRARRPPGDATACLLNPRGRSGLATSWPSASRSLAPVAEPRGATGVGLPSAEARFPRLYGLPD